VTATRRPRCSTPPTSTPSRSSGGEGRWHEGLILTCKHHDGFCLWPSRYTEHSVKNSPWRGGRGDVVKEISAACARQDVKFGVYLSRGTQSQRLRATEYLTYYRINCASPDRYGPIFEIFFDGANAATATTAAPTSGAKSTTRPTTTGRTRGASCASCSPTPCSQRRRPDIRWVGNERGIAAKPVGRPPTATTSHRATPTRHA